MRGSWKVCCRCDVAATFGVSLAAGTTNAAGPGHAQRCAFCAHLNKVDTLPLLLLLLLRVPAGDFAVIVKTLQRYPSVDVDHILRAASRLPPCATVLGAPV